jgi:iron(III) transport system permease protein
MGVIESIQTRRLPSRGFWLLVADRILRNIPLPPRVSAARLAVLLAAVSVATLVLVVPTYLLVRMSGGLAELQQTLWQARTLDTLGNTLLLAGSVTLASAALAVPLAWLTTSTDLPGRRAWAVLAALPLVIPSYVAAYLFSSMLSPKGLLQQLLGPLLGIERFPPVVGFPGAFLVLTLISYPYTFLTVRAALKRMDPALLEAARSLGQSPRRAFWRVMLPYLRPSIVAGSLLVALYSLRDFGVVNILQYSTFTRVIYSRYQTYRLETAAALALVLVVLTAVILYLEWRSRGRARYARLSIGAARQMQLVRLGHWRWPALLFCCVVVSMALLAPATGLLYWFWRGVEQEWGASNMGAMSMTALMEPAWHSLSASLAAGALAMVAALPVALYSVRRPGWLSHLCERFTYATFALPGIVVALAFVYFGLNVTPSLYQTLPMLLLAYVVLFIPQAVGAERASLLQVSPCLEEAGRSLGKSPWRILQQITLPLVRPGLLAGGALVFLTCMKELPATLILSPLGFNTLAAQVWTNITEAFFARAALPALLLILLSSVPLALLTLRDEQNQ